MRPHSLIRVAGLALCVLCACSGNPPQCARNIAVNDPAPQSQGEIGAQACPGDVTPVQLARDFTDFWAATPGGSSQLILEGDIFQLGFPGAGSVSVWHRLQNGETGGWSGPYGIQKICSYPYDKNSCHDGQPVKAIVSRRGVDGLTSASSKQEFAAELVVFSGLQPDTEYKISIPGNRFLRARTMPVERTPEKTSFIAFSCNNPFAPGIPEKSHWNDAPANCAEKNEDPRCKMDPAKRNSLALFSARASGKLAIKGWPKPAFALGLGDQIYTDGDNGKYPRFALFRGNRSWPSFDPRNSNLLLDLVYRAHFSLPSFHRALQHIPTAMIWDDHDVRDGFGTETNRDGQFSEFDSAARSAFLAYQWLRGPIAGKSRPEGTMDAKFSWGKQIQVLLLDTRSSGAQGVFWSRQLEMVKAWLNEKSESVGVPSINGQTPAAPDSPEKVQNSERGSSGKNEQIDGSKKGQEKMTNNQDEHKLFVLGLPSPLTVASDERLTQKVESKIARLNPETRDDLEDLWSNKETARRELVALLQDHFMKHRNQRLLIVSGDLHFSGIHYLSTGDGSRFHREKNFSDTYKSHRVTCNQESRQHYDSKFSKPDPDALRKEIGHKDNDVLWGWEVVSSGLANSAVVDDMLGRWGLRKGTINAIKKDVFDNQEGDSLMTTWGQGVLQDSPSFAEFLIENSDSKPSNAPRVSVVFYPSKQDGEVENNYLDVMNVPEFSLDRYDTRLASTDEPVCSMACPANKAKPGFTAIPLDWNCIPETDTESRTYSCLHACSVYNDRSGKGESSREK